MRIEMKQKEFILDSQNNRVSMTQGSVIGPLNFIIFLNKLQNLPQGNYKIINYADDTNSIICEKKILSNINPCGKNWC